MKQRLASVIDGHPSLVAEVRGEGLLIGIRCIAPVADVIVALRQQGMLAASAGENVLRLLPPLIVAEGEIDEAMSRLDGALTALEGAKKKTAAVR